jgi:hypothetical protein
MPLNQGRKYGREIVRAISDPLDGTIISDTQRSTGVNQWVPMAAASRGIEGVVVKALAANTGTIYVTGAEGNTDGYPLAAGESVSIATDNLLNVHIYVSVSGDGFAWLAIEQAR